MARKSTRLEDIANAANVSISTVSRALNDHPAINDATKKRIWQLAMERDYNFKPSMPALISGAAATIIIVIPRPQGRHGKISDPFFHELIGGVAQAARESSCNLIVSHAEPNSFEDLEHLMIANRTSGVLFLGQSVLHEQFNQLAQQETRFVVWGAEISGQQYCSVGSDNERGGKRATSHLIRLGRKRIAFLGNTDAPEVMQRFQGYQAAHRLAGFEYDNSLVRSAHFEVESAESAVNKLLSSGHSFDGIFAASDLVALGASRALHRAGKTIPEDVSIVGYDNIQLSAYSQPSLSTISQDMDKAGRLLVSKLLEAESGARIRSERLPTDLIVRESCGG